MYTATLVLTANQVTHTVPNNESLRLLGLTTLKPLWMVSSTVAIGQPILAVHKKNADLTKDTHILALYLLDHNCRPFQVTGTKDLLLDSNEWQDLTTSYLPTLRCGYSIFQAVYHSLELKEMREYEIILRTWEQYSLQEMLNKQMSWTECITTVLRMWQVAVYSEELNQRVQRVLRNISAPKNTILQQPIQINLEGYPLLSRD